MEYNRDYFKGMIAAVTGGASGIGLALCEELLESGADKVVLADFNKDNLALHEKRLNEQYPGRVKGVFCNVTVEDDVKHMVDKAAAFGNGRLDLLINCAGSGFMSKFTAEPDGVIEGDIFRSRVATNEHWHGAFALNFYGAVYGCRAALPYMLNQRSGQILNIISGIAFAPMAYQSMYSATKAALAALTVSLRYEYWDYSVRFNTATPGTTATAIFCGNAPPEAQSPHQSAQRILHGVASNDRIILGDDADMGGGASSFLPDAAGRSIDKVYLGFAKIRKSGTMSFVPIETDEKEEPSELASVAELTAIAQAAPEQMLELAKRYIANRKPVDLDKRHYEGKTAVITGGADGIGLALCEKLLECGAEKVVLTGADKDVLADIAQRLNVKYPDKVKAICCDMSDEESVKSMIADARAKLGNRIDLLINSSNAKERGMFAATPDAAEITARTGMQVEPPEALERLFDKTFYSALYACRAALPIMLEEKGGQIVNLVGAVSFAPAPYESAYASCEAAIRGLTLVLRYEYWDTGVRFNVATPGLEGAQTPEQSATRILAGLAQNDRIACGDDSDLLATMFSFNHQANAPIDKAYAEIARTKRG